jgi:hypothetical protein
MRIDTKAIAKVKIDQWSKNNPKGKMALASRKKNLGLMAEKL